MSLRTADSAVSFLKCMLFRQISSIWGSYVCLSKICTVRGTNIFGCLYHDKVFTQNAETVIAIVTLNLQQKCPSRPTKIRVTCSLCFCESRTCHATKTLSFGKCNMRFNYCSNTNVLELSPRIMQYNCGNHSVRLLHFEIV